MENSTGPITWWQFREEAFGIAEDPDILWRLGGIPFEIELKATGKSPTAYRKSTYENGGWREPLQR